MKNKKKLIKRIGAVLCALVVAVSSLGMSGTYYADMLPIDILASNKDKLVYYCDSVDFEMPASGYDNYALFHNSLYDSWTLYLFNAEKLNLRVRYFTSAFVNELVCGYLVSSASGGGCLYRSSDNFGTWTKIGDSDFELFEFNEDRGEFLCFYEGEASWSSSPSIQFHSSSVPIYLNDVVIFNGDEGFSDPMGKYNASLGYLQNVKHNVVFDDVPLGENVADTFTERWYYDSLSTTGVDLTSGDYVIRYYQEKWIVTGYGENDVVKKSDRYVLGDYIVQNGYIETYSENVESTLVGQGYVEPSIFDLLWNKFVTTHYYFQIVNAKTNEVGGLLHVYLTDDNGKFGVEHIGETLDNEGNFDEGGYKDFIDEDKVTTDDVEQGFNDLENGSNVDFGTVDGVDEFGVILESFASQVSNVTGGVRALLSSMPPWVLGLLGVSFVLLVVGIIFKIV